MQRIRIKKAPKLGDQVDYSFYDSRYHNTGMAGNTEDQVKNTMGPIPREEATIEVERGEVVVGDTNQDGFLELFTFGGKPHSQGGTPVDVPPGSFIYSNTRKLRIKDKELVTKVFGLAEKKGGYTPAEIAKRYQINEHVATLKDDRADSIQKRSASEMLKNNLDKLGVLALVQESMKGFPDGIPAIAESAAVGLGMDPAMFDPAKQQEMAQQQMPEQIMAEGEGMEQMMQYGGLRKYQKAGTVGDKFFINGQQNGITSRYKGFFGDEWVKLANPIVMTDQWGNKEYMTEMTTDDFNKLVMNGKLDMAYEDNAIAPSHYTDVDNLGWWNQDRSIVKVGRGAKLNTLNFSLDGAQPQQQKPAHLQPGFEFTKGNKRYRVLNSDVYSPYGTENGDRRAVNVQQISDPDHNVGSFFDTKLGQELIPLSEFNAMMGVNAQQASAQTAAQQQATGVSSSLRSAPPGAQVLNQGANRSQDPVTNDLQKRALAMGWFDVASYRNSGWKKNEALLENARAMGWGDDIEGYRDSGWKRNPQSGRSSAQGAASKPATSTGAPKTVDDIFNKYREGGSLPTYQTGKTDLPDPNVEQKIGEEVLDGVTYTIYYKGDQKIVKNDKGEVVKSGPRTDTGGKNFSQYGSQNIKQIVDSQPNTIYSAIPFGTFGKQEKLGNTGIYLSSNNVKNRTEGSLTAEEWADFQKRHGDWIDQSYQSPNGNGKGLEGFKKDLMASEATGNKAAEWFQDKVNEYAEAQFGKPYFAKEKSAENPYTRDSRFGQVTFSVPRFFNVPEQPKQDPPKEKETPPPPGMKKAYYCVEGEDGTRGVQEVEYAENSTPTAPAGKSVKQYSSRAEADAGCVATPSNFKREPIKRGGPWWAQDIVTFTDAMTRDVNKYEPMMQQLDLLTSEYTPLKKDAQVANIQQMQNQFMNLAANSADGNVAMASAMGASGDSFQNAANVMSQIENQNSLMATQNSKDNVGIENQERQLNAGLRGQYVGQSATANQQVDNANNKLQTNRLEALKAGMTNWGRKKLDEQVLTPQVYIDPINYDAQFSGEGRDYSLPDLYQNPYLSGTGTGRGTKGSPQMTALAATSDADIQLYDKYYNELLPKYGKEQAEKIALQKMSQYNQLLRSNPNAMQYIGQSAGIGYPGGFTPEYAGGGAITVEDLFYMLNHAKKR